MYVHLYIYRNVKPSQVRAVFDQILSSKGKELSLQPAACYLTEGELAEGAPPLKWSQVQYCSYEYYMFYSKQF